MLTADIITPAVSQARQRILNAQLMLASVEGRTLDFETAEAIQRTLHASLQDLAPIIGADDVDLSDEELDEFEARLTRDSHDDADYWTGGAR